MEKSGSSYQGGKGHKTRAAGAQENWKQRCLRKASCQLHSNIALAHTWGSFCFGENVRDVISILTIEY